MRPNTISLLLLAMLALGCPDSGELPISNAGLPELPDDAGSLEDSIAVDVEPVDPSCAGKKDDDPCDDGDPCTEEATCQKGTCVRTVAKAFSETNPCHTYTGCIGGQPTFEDKPDGATCESKCNEGATCQAGECTGGATKPCPAPGKDQPCVHHLECNSDSGECDIPIYDPIDTPCDLDGDLCTVDLCQPVPDGSIECTPTGPKSCAEEAAKYPCNAYTCVKGVCGSMPKSAEFTCDDKDPCTEDDHCGNPGVAACKGSPIDVDDGNPCTDDSCSPAGIVHKPADGKACKYDECTLSAVCVGDTCIKVKAIVCDDGKPCTDDSCSPQSGCLFTAVKESTPCNDLNQCTESDQCDGAGGCSGKGKSCDDGNPCTDDHCDPAEDCSHTDNSVNCDDGDSCTKSDQCSSGTCAGKAVVCGDGNACNGVESCVAGVCAAGSALACSDDNPCTADSCDPALGCIHVALSGEPCADGDLCNGAELCQGGVCEKGAALDCDDEDACTLDSCEPSTGCEQSAAPDATECDDDDACTQKDTCQSGTCVGADPVTCAPADACHDAGACNGETGLCTSPAKADGSACSDNDACTVVDTCLSGLCSGASPVICTATDDCHDAGACDPATGACSTPATAAGAPCSDGDPCTVADACDGGTCVPGAVKACAGAEECKDAGTCDQATGGCVQASKPEGAECGDGDPCTIADRCVLGACIGGGELDCDDANPCTDESCDSTLGCVHVANTAPCDDLDACTLEDTCQAKLCVPGSPKVCGLGDACHDAEACDSATGSCVEQMKADGFGCDDGDECTQVDACQTGECQGGSPVVCAALDACHVAGECDTATGLCSQPARPDGTVCPDVSPCATDSTCHDGICMAGSDCEAVDLVCSSGECVATGSLAIRFVGISDSLVDASGRRLEMVANPLAAETVATTVETLVLSLFAWLLD